jgi:hypothetical protein
MCIAGYNRQMPVLSVKGRGSLVLSLRFFTGKVYQKGRKTHRLMHPLLLLCAYVFVPEDKKISGWEVFIGNTALTSI